MYSIIKHIPSVVTLDALENQLRPIVKGLFFQSKENVKAIKLIELVDKHGRPIERHALVRVSSQSALKRLVKSVNRQSFKENLLWDIDDTSRQFAASEFVARHWDNQPRVINDRRRLNLRIVPISEKLCFSEYSRQFQPVMPRLSSS